MSPAGNCLAISPKSPSRNRITNRNAAALAAPSRSSNPEISGAMVGDKVKSLKATGAERVVSADCGCLMNILGHAAWKDQQEGRPNPRCPASTSPASCCAVRQGGRLMSARDRILAKLRAQILPSTAASSGMSPLVPRTARSKARRQGASASAISSNWRMPRFMPSRVAAGCKALGSAVCPPHRQAAGRHDRPRRRAIGRTAAAASPARPTADRAGRPMFRDNPGQFHRRPRRHRRDRHADPLAGPNTSRA